MKRTFILFAIFYSLFAICYLLFAIPYLFAFEKVKFRSPSSGKTVDVVKGEILVVFKPGVSISKKEALHRAIGVQKISDDTDGRFFQKVKIPEGETLENVIEKYKKDASVKYAEPNYIRKKYATVNDPLFTVSSTDTAKQWGLAKIDIMRAWGISTGTGVIVAVLDTGLDNSHPEFIGQTVSTTAWRNFISTTPATTDADGHGTHVAGIIGARSNGQYVVGVATNSKILPIKVLERAGGTIESVVRGLIYVSTVSIDGAKVRVVNLSFGGDIYSHIENHAIQQVYNKGISIIAASGNENAKVAYPAGYQNVLAVGASDLKDVRADFSNYGSNLNMVAPGVKILSTHPLLKDATRYASGTSMATPFVAGVAALMLSVNPNLQPRDVYTILTQTANDIGAPGFDIYTGNGRLNAYRAVNMAKTGVPRVVSKTYSYPNPLRIDKKEMAYFEIPDAIYDSQVKIRIYNFAGDIVKSLEVPKWDGKDENGNLVSTGLYFFAVETKKGKSTGKMTVIR